MVDLMIGDSHALFVDLLTSVLTERGYGVVECADTGERLVAGLRRRRPHACLIDHRSLAGRERGRLLEEVCAASVSTKVVVVSTGRAGPAADTAASLRVDGVLDKRASLHTLLDGLRRVLDGEAVTATPVRSGGRASDDAVWFQRQAESLTARERECLAMLVEGRTTAQIERSLSISVMTVRSHIRSMLRKLGAHTRLEAASLAMRYDLLPDDLGTSRAG